MQQIGAKTFLAQVINFLGTFSFTGNTKTMKYIKILFLVLVTSLVGCSFPWEDVPIENNLLGDYFYTSNAVYFDDSGTEFNKKTGDGSIAFAQDLSIYPSLGWVYRINFENLEEHILSNGDRIFTFNIPSQEVDISSGSFSIFGMNAYEVTDIDGTIIGNFDGWINANNEIHFSCESWDLYNKTKTQTVFKATKR